MRKVSILPVDDWKHCPLYTFDAADDLLRVVLGGRRIIKKKKNTVIPILPYSTPEHECSTRCHDQYITTSLPTITD